MGKQEDFSLFILHWQNDYTVMTWDRIMLKKSSFNLNWSMFQFDLIVKFQSIFRLNSYVDNGTMSAASA